MITLHLTQLAETWDLDPPQTCLTEPTDPDRTVQIEQVVRRIGEQTTYSFLGRRLDGRDPVGVVMERQITGQAQARLAGMLPAVACGRAVVG